jgi:hypothetical protein
MSVVDFSSSSDYAARGEDPNFALQYLELALPESVKNKTLSVAIHESEKRGYSYVYNLKNTNCTTGVFDILDASMDHAKPIKKFRQSLLHLKDPVAGPSIKALLERGAIYKSPDGSVPSIWVPFGYSLP